jgi:hypothetical protein
LIIHELAITKEKILIIHGVEKVFEKAGLDAYCLLVRGKKEKEGSISFDIFTQII